MPIPFQSNFKKNAIAYCLNFNRKMYGTVYPVLYFSCWKTKLCSVHDSWLYYNTL